MIFVATGRAGTVGDVDCDGRLTDGDLDVLVATLFEPNSSRDCGTADVNGDGAPTAADAIAVVRALETPPTPTPEPRTGPHVSYLGIVAADGTAIDPVAVDPQGRVMFQRPAGFGFYIVVEAARGSNTAPVGTTVFNFKPGDATARPDLEIQASQNLGDGNPGVCSEGGIPGFDPPDFSTTQAISNALNDFACAFSANTNPTRACTSNKFGSPAFIAIPQAEVQFCLLVSSDKAFPLGDTALTVQVHDVAGDLGSEARIVVRIGNQPVPTRTATASRTSTPTRTASATPTRGSTGTPTVKGSATIETATPSATATSLVPTLTRTPSATASPRPSMSPTLSPTGSRPPTSSPTATRSRSATPLPTGTPTTSQRPSVTPTQTATNGPTRTSSAPPPGTRTATPSAAVAATRTRTSTPTHTFTRTPTGTRPPTPTAVATRTATLTPTAPFTRTPTDTRIPTATPTVTATPTITATRTVTPTFTVTSTSTPTIPPMITFLGVAKSDGTVVEEPVEVTPEKIQVFQRPSYGFFLVVEGRPGLLTVPLGTSTFRWSATDPSILPDLQVLVSNKLGDGSSFVCDDNPSMRGGVPAAIGFLPTQQVADAINDLGCRFKDSDERPGGRRPNDACTRLSDGFDRFYKSNSTVQFCALIDKPYEFSTGDTLVTVRIRDIAGILSEEARIIIRVP